MNILHLKKASINYILINLILILLFSCLYYCSNFVDSKKGIKELHNNDDKKEITFGEALGYSLITQTTVGYTVFIPMTTWTKNVNLLQLISIVFVVAMFI